MMGESGWGIVCHHETTPTITKAVGEVICRQSLGQFLLAVSNTSHPPVGYEGVFYGGSISCSGRKNHLSECTVRVRPQPSCPSGYTKVKCTPGIYTKQQQTLDNTTFYCAQQPLQTWCLMSTDSIGHYCRSLHFKYSQWLDCSVHSRKTVSDALPHHVATPGRCLTLCHMKHFV